MFGDQAKSGLGSEDELFLLVLGRERDIVQLSPDWLLYLGCLAQSILGHSCCLPQTTLKQRTVLYLLHIFVLLFLLDLPLQPVTIKQLLFPYLFLIRPHIKGVDILLCLQTVDLGP